MARNCAYDLAKYNIRVNSVCPGAVETPISAIERKEHGWTFEEWEKLKVKKIQNKIS
jgi:NAD(P)-dependent dehydrogenase (short-subunit alcohol dehydrogenase family)